MYNQRPETLVGLLDPQVLENTLDGAFQLLFSLAVAQELVRGPTVAAEVKRDIQSRGFVVNTLWARGGQGRLVVVAAMVAALCVINGRRRCELDGEPSSLAEALQLLTASPGLYAEIEGVEFQAHKQLSNALILGDRKYKLLLIPEHGPLVKVLGMSEATSLAQEVDGCQEHVRLTPPTDDSLEPWMENRFWTLTMAFGVALMVSLGIVTLLLVVAFGYARGYIGQLC